MLSGKGCVNFHKCLKSHGFGFQIIDFKKLRKVGESKLKALRRQTTEFNDIFGSNPDINGYYRECNHCGKNTLRPVSVKYVDEFMEVENKNAYRLKYPERFTKPVKFKRCSRCKLVYYCDGKCQGKDWKNHKKNCNKN